MKAVTNIILAINIIWESVTLMKKERTGTLVGALAIALLSTYALQGINEQAVKAGPKKSADQSKIEDIQKVRTSNFWSIQLK